MTEAAIPTLVLIALAAALLQNLTRVADQSLIGWATGRGSTTTTPPAARPRRWPAHSDQLHPIANASDAFSLNYLSNPTVKAPTRITVPAQHYPAGNCAQTSAGKVHKVPGALEVTNPSKIETVEVTITPGQCPHTVRS